MTDQIRQNLQSVSIEDYPKAEYRAHTLEIYKTYLASTQSNSDRRMAANTFFLSIHTLLIGGSGLSLENDERLFALLISLLGMMFAWVWRRLVKSYRQLNHAKFKVVHEIERYLPIAAYDAEWKALAEGKDPNVYHPYTHLEPRIAWAFFWFHAIVAGVSALLLLNIPAWACGLLSS